MFETEVVLKSVLEDPIKVWEPSAEKDPVVLPNTRVLSEELAAPGRDAFSQVKEV